MHDSSDIGGSQDLDAEAAFNFDEDGVEYLSPETIRTLSLLNATLESTTDGILVVDIDGKIASFNKQFATMWGIPASIFASRDDQKAIEYVLNQLIDPQSFVAKVTELYENPDSDSFDVLEFKDGRIFERYSKPQRTGDQVVGRVWSFRDVTEARRTQEQLLAVRQELEDRVIDRTAQLEEANASLLGEVAERQVVEDALLQEKQRLEDVTWHANCGLFLLDAEAKVIYCNKLVETWFGPAGELNGQYCWQIFSLTDPENECAALEVLRTKKAVSGESFTKIVNGQTRVFYVVATPVMDRKGNVRQITEVVVDVTERRATEDALRKAHDELEERVLKRTAELARSNEALLFSEEKFRAISESAQDAIVMIRSDERISYWNKAAHTTFGYSREEAIGQPLHSLIIPDRLVDQHLRGFGKFVKTGSGPVIGRTIELIGKTKDGREVPIELSLSSVNIRGEWRAIGMVRDITERKKSEEALRRLSRQNELILNSAGDGIFGLDVEGRVAFANPAASSLTGYAIDELIGCKPWDLIHNSSVRPPEEFIQGAVARDDEEFFSRKDGSVFPVEYASTPIWEDGGLAGAVVTFKDITERKRQEEMLSESLVKVKAALEGVIKAMALTLEKRDPYTAGHQQRVAYLASTIAKEMGLSEDEIEGIRMASLIHDIGKIYVPAEILSKPGRLSGIEFDMIRTHAEIGFDILKSIEFDQPIAEIAFQHHERMDGSGYPLGVSGDKLLIGSRILAVADVVEAMASHRPYRPSRGIDMALEEIKTNSGKLYDPEVVKVCTALFTEKGFNLEL